MSFIVTMSNSEPATTKAVFGNTEFKTFYLDLDQATASEQKTCADFLALVGGHITVNIINSNHDFDDCNYVLVNGMDGEIVEIDYSSLTTENKEKIDLFANMLKSLAQ